MQRRREHQQQQQQQQRPLRRLEGTPLLKVIALPQRLGLSMLRCLEAHRSLKDKVRFIRSQPIAVILERSFQVSKRWRYPILTRSKGTQRRSTSTDRAAF